MDATAIVNDVFQKTGVRLSNDDPMVLGALMLSAAGEELRQHQQALVETIQSVEPNAIFKRAEEERQQAVVLLGRANLSMQNAVKDFFRMTNEVLDQRKMSAELLAKMPKPEHIAAAYVEIANHVRNEKAAVHNLITASDEFIKRVLEFDPKAADRILSEIDALTPPLSELRKLTDETLFQISVLVDSLEEKSAYGALRALRSGEGQEAISNAVFAGIGGIADASAWGRIMSLPHFWAGTTVAMVVGFAAAKFF